jgi:hypothetical protein
MKLSLYKYQVMEAIEQYLQEKGIHIEAEEEVSLELSRAVYQVKKHKNGKPVMNKHGYPEREYVKTETHYEFFYDDDEFIIYIKQD